MYNPNKDVMKKVVYDSIAKYKAEKEGIWWKKLTIAEKFNAEYVEEANLNYDWNER